MINLVIVSQFFLNEQSEEFFLNLVEKNNNPFKSERTKKKK